VREGVGGQLVYSTSSMLRLIEATGGDIVGANLVPAVKAGNAVAVPASDERSRRAAAPVEQMARLTAESRPSRARSTIRQ
jgi:hypothetical protein